MFDGRFKDSFERGLRPVGLNLRRTGVRADHLTALGLVVSVACAVAIGSGALRAGLVLLVLTGLPDLLDGAVAKASGTASPRGAFFDSVADRVTDAVVLGGVAWYLASTSSSPHVVLLPFAVLTASMLVSYQRARAESLGFSARGGLMERAERLAVLGVGLLFHSVMVPVLVVLLALTLVTAGQRFVTVWRQASAPLPPVPSLPSGRWRRRRLARPTTRPTARAWRRRAHLRRR